MKTLRQQRPEIPVVLGRPQICTRIAFHRTIQIREVVGITNEKHRRIVADHIPVTVLGVDLTGCSANIPFRIGCPPLSGNGRKLHKDLGLCAWPENLCFRVLRDVVRNRKRAVGPRSFHMHSAFRNDLTIKVGEFFQQPHVLQQNRPAFPRRDRMLVFRYRSTDFVGEFLVFG